MTVNTCPDGPLDGVTDAVPAVSAGFVRQLDEFDTVTGPLGDCVVTVWLKPAPVLSNVSAVGVTENGIDVGVALGVGLGVGVDVGVAVAMAVAVGVGVGLGVDGFIVGVGVGVGVAGACVGGGDDPPPPPLLQAVTAKTAMHEHENRIRRNSERNCMAVVSTDRIVRSSSWPST